MSGLHEAFDEIVADVPVYGDLDRAVEQADQDRRRRRGAVVGLVAAAVVLAVLGALAAAVSSRDVDSSPPVTPGPSPVTPSPTIAKSQSPETWVDNPVAARDGYGWEVPDPLKRARNAWFAVAADHLASAGAPLQGFVSSAFGVEFEQQVEGSIHPTYGRLGLVADGSDPNPMDGCRYLTIRAPTTPGTVSCSEERFAGPDGERARIARWGRQCSGYEGGGPAPADCGDYRVAVAVERHDGRIGYVELEGRGAPDRNPFAPADLAAAAADPRLTLPETAFAFPSDATVVSVVEEHFPGYRADDLGSAPQHPGYAQTYGELRRVGLGVQVLGAGSAPTCGRSWLIDCVQRRVFGADDPTTVFVGAWDQEDWADCCPRNSRSDSRVFVHVGPRHTVVVLEFKVVRANEEPLSAALDQRLIDLAIDPRLQ